MTQEAVRYSSSLLCDLGEQGHLVLEFRDAPEEGKYRCSVATWGEGQLEYVERHLAAAGMAIDHRGELSWFWVPTCNLTEAINRVRQAFAPHYEFEVEHWYNVPSNERIEFRLQDRRPDTHNRVEVEPTVGNQDQVLAIREAFVQALRESGLCIPGSVRFKGFTCHLALTAEAAANSIETFATLVNLHPFVQGMDNGSSAASPS